MFVYIKHGDKDQFHVNTNCPVFTLLQYVRSRLGLAESELLDLCDEQGVMKLLFLPQHSQEYASGLLTSRGSFIVCSVHQTLQTQIDNLERTRLKQLRIGENHKALLEEANAQSTTTQTTKRRRKAVHVNVPDEVQRRAGDKKSRN